MKVKSLSGVRLLATPWTAAYQALLSMGFSRQEYWSGLPLPSPEDPLEKEMATYFSILAWEISWTEEPGRLQSMESDTSEVT